MSAVLGSRRSPRTDPGAFLSISERARYLAVLRVTIAAGVVVMGLTDLVSRDVPPTTLLPGAFAYLGLVAGAEALRRRSVTMQRPLVRGVLLLDGIFLAWAVAISGAATSPIRFLAFAHVIGVTVVFSYRSGLAIAMWHSLLLLLVAYAEPAGLLDGGRPSEDIGKSAIATVVALWVTALATGTFSAISERELLRQKGDLERLSTMLARIQLADDAGEIASILVNDLADTFGFLAGAVFAWPTGELRMIADAGVRSSSQMPIDDATPRDAIQTRRVVAVARFDPDRDPGLAELFEGSRNLLVVPLLVERGRALGVVVLERGGRHRAIRRWIVSMVEQFASHGALALNSAWLAEERDARMREIEQLQAMLELHNAQLEEIVEERTAELRSAIEHLEDVDRQRRRLLDHVVRAGEDERKRIAGDIHDDPVQKLVALKMRLELLSKQNPQLGDIQEGTAWVATAIQSLRHLLFDLRPPVLDEQGLAAALTSFLGNADVTFTWTVDDELDREPTPQTRLILYRIAQEVLTNARKHSEAEHVRVRLSEHLDEVLMEISDDGIGFEPRVGIVAEPGHMGLAAIRERAEMAGGRCELHSLPGQGTTFEVWLPMSVEPEELIEPDDPVALALVPGDRTSRPTAVNVDPTNGSVNGRRAFVG
jgi:signal transduction histidine kinase